MAIVYDRNLGVYKDTATGQVVNADGSSSDGSGASKITDEEFGRSMSSGDNAYAGAFLPAQSADDTRDANVARHLATQRTTAQTNAALEAQKQNAKPTVYEDIRRSAEAGRGAGVELPFIRHAPGGRAIEGVFEAAQAGPLAAAQYAVDNPGKTLLTGGLAAGIAGVDTAADKVASGIAEEINDTERADVNLPLTPRQLYEPNGPLYDPGNIDGSGKVNVPGLRDIGEGIVEGVGDIAGGIGDLFRGGGGGGGGGNTGTGYGTQVAKAAIENAAGEQARTRQLGADVLTGNVAPASTADRQLQLDELERAREFLTGPRRQEDVMGSIDRFLAAPQGPSAAEIQLTQAQDDSMSDALSLARGARGGAGATNRALRVAMAENAATQSTGARDLALLRAKEEQARRDETLRGIGLQGTLAQGLDADTLRALGQAGTLAAGIGQQGVTARGQTLDAGTGLAKAALGSTTDIAGTSIPAYLRDDLERAKLGYELTPDQKLLFASLGAGSDLLSLFL